jgi:putative endonuclease
VYILQCSDGTLYIGTTNNLEKRLIAHNTSKYGAHYTKIRRPVALVYSENCKTRGNALKREHALKKLSRKEKLNVIATHCAGLKENG